MTRIALLGTGHMGAPIAGRLLAAGHQLTVWNRTAARTDPLAAAGARVAATPADAVRDADLVITMLTDSTALDAVLFAPAGAAEALPPGSCLVEMSTIGPTAVAALRDRLPSGVTLVDAPVSGGVGAAANGKLVILAGGDPELVSRVAPVLAELGEVRRCGPSGSGAALKLVLNTATVTGFAALADALTVADAVKIDRDTALAALATGALGGVVQRAGPGGAFTIALAGKDLDLALAELGDLAAPVAQAAADRLRGVADPTADVAALTQKELP
ncbi:MAG: NAD(P)-dependent oxidoreductase [Sporichthyaceae bacterium]|nr:NAD(P)-dependent oxidoreductase [Sporichthyaceae bacterium]